ncbi:MAG: NYN domain-containing protein [Chloroflexota bacterium]
MVEPQRKIAVLIDGDNAPPSSIPEVLKKIRKLGELIIRRAYGDLFADNMSSWEDIQHTYFVQLIQQPRYVAGKNATDMAMVIGAMDILHEGNINTFCLVSSDSDFTPLAIYLREQGCEVIGVGKKNTNKAFINACTQFITIDPSTAVSEKKPTPIPPAKKASKITEIAKIIKAPKIPEAPKGPSPVALLKKAYKATPQQDGWVFLAQLGHTLGQLDVEFNSSKYGHSTLGKLVRAYPDLFEVKGDKAEVYVKLKS